MRCSMLAIAVLATVAWGAPVVQGVPLQQSGPVKPDLLHSATTCSPRNPLDNGLPSSLLTSRSVTAVRWTTPDAPGIALRILVMDTVPSGARLAVFMSGLVMDMAGQPQAIQGHRLPQGFMAYEAVPVAGARLLFSICPYPTGNPLLTWDMAHQVLFSLCRYMAMGGSRLVQFHAFMAGATPDQDVQFASGAITMATVGAIPAVAPQARRLPAELVGGRRRR